MTGPQGSGRWRPTVGSVPWSARDALVAIVGAHAALLVGGVIVYGIGGWPSGRQPIGADVAAVVPFWMAGLVLSVQLARRDAAGPAVALGLGPGGGPVRRVLEVLGGAAAGVVTSVALLPVVYSVVHRLAGTDADDLERPARALADRAGSGAGAVLLVLMTCVAAPVVEEVLYRGVLLPALANRGSALAVLGAAVVFAAGHLQLLQLPGLVLIGLVLGALRVGTGGLVAPIAAHAGFNAAAVVVLLTQR